MRRKVLLFAAARERAGSAELEVELADGARARDVVAAAVAVAPALAPIAAQLRVALAHSFVAEDAPIGEGELALLPPVSGGAGRLLRVTPEPLSVDRAIAAVRDDQHGAVATFSGVVRDHSDGRRVHRLDYEAYLPMAEHVLGAICAELETIHAPARLAIEHRIGSLGVGELAVVIAAGAPHRREALAACAEAIDRIKAELPMWKREHTDAGAEWVGCGGGEHRHRDVESTQL